MYHNILRFSDACRMKEDGTGNGKEIKSISITYQAQNEGGGWDGGLSALIEESNNGTSIEGANPWFPACSY